MIQYSRTNIQNEGEAETRVATADYLEVKRPDGPILSPITKRTGGATCIKIKKSCVESTTTSSTSSMKCGLCMIKMLVNWERNRSEANRIDMAKNRFVQHGRERCCCRYD